MTANRKLMLAVLTGIAIGIAGATAIHAQQTKTPPGYVIAEVEVTDPNGIKEYGAKVPETMAPFNHQYVIRGGRTKSLEGEPPKGIIVIQFDSFEKAQEWYESPAYQTIRPIRLKSAKARLYISEGFAPK